MKRLAVYRQVVVDPKYLRFVHNKICWVGFV